MHFFHFIFLIALTCLYWVQSLAVQPFFVNTWVTQGLVLLSSLFQTNFIFVGWLNNGYFPLSNLYESLLFLSWALTTFLGVMHLNLYSFTTNNVGFGTVGEQKRELPWPGHFWNPTVSGSILMPIIVLVNAFISFLPQQLKQTTALVPALQSNWLQMHVVVMISAYAFLILGGLFSIAYLVVSLGYMRKPNSFLPHQASQHFNASSLTTLPSKQTTNGAPTLSSSNATQVEGTTYATLQQNSQKPYWGNEKSNQVFSDLETNRLTQLAQMCDNYSYRSIGLGWPLLTMGLLSGAVWANQTWGSYWSWDPKETWALITWFIFAIYLHTRLSKGWNGQKSAWLAVFGFITLWICYLGVNLMAKGLHSYGFFQ